MADKWSRPPVPISVVPSEAFPVGEPEKCGFIEFADGDIEINVDRRSIELVLINTGDRPVQIGAHFHIAECNRAMAFDREAAFGMRLDIPSGTAVRFEPGQSRRVQLTTYVGREVAYGMNGMVNGSVRSEIVKDLSIQKLKAHGFCFEGERFKARKRPDDRFASKDLKDSKRSKGVRRTTSPTGPS